MEVLAAPRMLTEGTIDTRNISKLNGSVVATPISPFTFLSMCARVRAVAPRSALLDPIEFFATANSS